MPSVATEQHQSGAVPGAGTFACLECSCSVALEALDQLPHCPHCGGSLFRRASLFEASDEPTAEFAPAVDESPPAWLERAREGLERPGTYLAYRDPDVQVVELERGWTRIGRSSSADVRLDDPTVSRRHVLLVREGDGELRVLDDRSLNGVYLNGERVEWATMCDGDELVVGRYRIYLVEA